MTIYGFSHSMIPHNSLRGLCDLCRWTITSVKRSCGFRGRGGNRITKGTKNNTSVSLKAASRPSVREQQMACWILTVIKLLSDRWPGMAEVQEPYLHQRGDLREHVGGHCCRLKPFHGCWAPAEHTLLYSVLGGHQHAHIDMFRNYLHIFTNDFIT